MTFCPLTWYFHTFSGFAHNIFYFCPLPPSEFSHRPFPRPFLHDWASPPPPSALGPGALPGRTKYQGIALKLIGKLESIS